MPARARRLADERRRVSTASSRRRPTRRRGRAARCAVVASCRRAIRVPMPTASAGRGGGGAGPQRERLAESVSSRRWRRHGRGSRRRASARTWRGQSSKSRGSSIERRSRMAARAQRVRLAGDRRAGSGTGAADHRDGALAAAPGRPPRGSPPPAGSPGKAGRRPRKRVIAWRRPSTSRTAPR